MKFKQMVTVIIINKDLPQAFDVILPYPFPQCYEMFTQSVQRASANFDRKA